MNTTQSVSMPPLADAEALVSSMSKVHRRLAGDLRERAADPRVEPWLQEAHADDTGKKRTGETYQAYREAFCDQVAASWVLCAVFVRTLEDRGYLPHRLAGPGASDRLAQFRSQFRFLGERDYLLSIFDALSLLPAGREVFGPGHAPLWRLAPSSRGIGDLLDELRSTEGGALRFSFGRPAGEEHDGASTRYLGDLYQDLNEGVRKRYALLQTPEFVERFLLDNTLDPAIRERGIAVTVLDPACGSGHLLLGAYDRLFDARRRAEPGVSGEETARKALRQVYGIDLNPYAAAIARFRLLLSYLDKAGIPKLDEVSRELGIHVYVEDSLLAGRKEIQITLGDDLARRGVTPERPGFERAPLLSFFDSEPDRLLSNTRFDVVVANPPYITEKNPKKRDDIRKLYKAATGKYALSVPFVERIFQLGNEGAFTGQITANSFMKREFGSGLIENVLPHVDLTEILDTSKAFIPGHGTPTVILFGRAQRPIRSLVRVVMGTRGEPAMPDSPAEGKVWSSIETHHQDVGYSDEYVSVADVEREKLAHHPWSLGGGGASELKELLEERAERRLSSITESIGISCFTLEDDVYLAPRYAHLARGMKEGDLRSMIEGDTLRDWSLGECPSAVFPYDCHLKPSLSEAQRRYLWPWKTNLANNILFGGKTKVQGGLNWFEFGRLTASKLRTPLSIAYAEVSTHNHFILDHGGRVFNRTAPVIKLPEGATEEEHFALVGYLNSSTACFWMKQVCHPKSNAGQRHHPDPSKFTYAFGSTRLEELPLLQSALLETLEPLARTLHELATQRLQDLHPVISLANRPSASTVRGLLNDRWRSWDELREQMIVLQEEVDWRVYVGFGLAPSRVLIDDKLLVGALCARGDRPFERIRKREGVVRVRGENRSLAESEQISDTPLAPQLAEAWTAREALIRDSPDITLIETAQFKRHWRDTDMNVTEAHFREMVDRQWLEASLLTSVEAILHNSAIARPISVRSIAQSLQSDRAALTVAEVLAGTATYDLEAVLADLLQKDAVSSAPCQVYTDAGIETRSHWERTWELQRLEELGQKVEITPPPKYDQKDFENASVIWRHRGKLDVPKERFIAYPTATPPPGASAKAGLTFGWAGWNHLEQLQAAIELWQHEMELAVGDLIPRATRAEREANLDAALETEKAALLRDAAAREKLMPILQTMVDLLPWVRQWHNEDGETADDFERYVTEQARRLEISLDDAHKYRRPAKTSGRGASRKYASTNDENAPAATSASAPSSTTAKTTRAPRTSSASETDIDAFLDTVRSLDQGEGVQVNDIGKSIALSAAVIKKTVDALVEAGRLVEKKKRPRIVACAPATDTTNKS